MSRIHRGRLALRLGEARLLLPHHLVEAARGGLRQLLGAQPDGVGGPGPLGILRVRQRHGSAHDPERQRHDACASPHGYCLRLPEPQSDPNTTRERPYFPPLTAAS